MAEGFKIDLIQAMIEALRGARLYIGTDTGPTQPATLLGRPMILFRSDRDDSPSLISAIVIPLSQKAGFPVTVVRDGWTRPEKVVDSALHYLNLHRRLRI